MKSIRCVKLEITVEYYYTPAAAIRLSIAAISHGNPSPNRADAAAEVVELAAAALVALPVPLRIVVSALVALPVSFAFPLIVVVALPPKVCPNRSVVRGIVDTCATGTVISDSCTPVLVYTYKQVGVCRGL